MTHNEDTKNILADDVPTALRKLITLTRGLIDFAQEEERALTLGDMIQLSAIQDSKEKMTFQYAQASAEFRSRLEEFRGADRALLNQLEKSQNDLNEKTQSNNILIEQLHQRALANTQATLVNAQELGQPVRFKNGHQQEQQEGA